MMGEVDDICLGPTRPLAAPRSDRPGDIGVKYLNDVGRFGPLEHVHKIESSLFPSVDSASHPPSPTLPMEIAVSPYGRQLNITISYATIVIPYEVVTRPFERQRVGRKETPTYRVICVPALV